MWLMQRVDFVGGVVVDPAGRLREVALVISTLLVGLEVDDGEVVMVVVVGPK